MLSIKTIIAESLREIGAIGWNEAAEGDDARIAESILNQVVAALNQEQLLPFSRTITDFPIVSSKRTYSIGTTTVPSDIVADRPLFINRIYWVPAGSSTPQEIIQCDLQGIIARSTSTGTSGTPTIYAYNPTYPAGTIHFEVNPSAGGSLRILSNKALEQVTSSSTPEWPPEYQQLLTLATARKLGSRRQAPQDTLANIDALYKEELSKLKYSNSRNMMGILNVQGAGLGSGWKGNLLAGY